MPYAFVRLLIALFLLVRHRYKRSFLSFRDGRVGMWDSKIGLTVCRYYMKS
ncbi:hypothetical protein HMPREF1555_00467 [Porphyromonas gingivalis F0570]|uniref:Uncharacterized protein n=1 Tax=Porphyromonas gingivalis F0570 TaxID=1227271 RepID=A0A0E2LSC2_PORGN|nr:hypothetical protein HMPREF1555_00467 [Porphyromonas gingivalis F0570]